MTPADHALAEQAAGIDHDDRVQFRCNGVDVEAEGLPTRRLSAVLREQLSQLDVKIGCNAGDCGACTVLVDGLPVCACLTAVSQVQGRQVQTLQGLEATEPLMRQLQDSFLRHGAAQCGICTPGMLVSALALLQGRQEPGSESGRQVGGQPGRQVGRQADWPSGEKIDEQAVKDALGGVLCRCTGYRKIIDAVLQATQYTPLEDPVTAQSVGVSMLRLDGRSKVAGADRFGDDVAPADARVCRLVRSPCHHAEFELGDLDAYVAQHAGIDCVLTARDIPGRNAFGVIPPFIDQPVFAERHTRFKGEVVAAIVGSARTLELLDMSRFPVSWTELPALLDPLTALQPDACQLHEHAVGNVLCEGLVQRGDAAAGLAGAYRRASGIFTTGFIEHACIEPEAGFAVRVGNRLEVHGCTQSAYMNRDSLALIMGIPAQDIRIVPSAVGGGFGTKLDLSYQPYVALAAWVLGQPVRLVFSRRESMQSTTKRHPARMSVEIGVDAEGRVCGFDFEGVFNTGAYASWGPTVANRVPIHASGPYYTPHYRAHTTGVYTHCAPAGAFRGFGVPQAAIAQESLFDELAEAMGMDRLLFRLNNAMDNGQATVTGQRFSSSVGIRACLQALQQPWNAALEDAREFNSGAAYSGSPLRRGVGLASGWYGCGNTSLPNPSTIKAGIRRDGRLCLHQGAVDIGQGSNTVITQIFADSLGVPVESIELIGADTDLSPDAGKTSASRQTFVSGNAARLSALALRADIARWTNCALLQDLVIDAGTLTVNPGKLDSACIDLERLPVDDDGYVFVASETYDPPTRALDRDGQGEPYALYGYAAQMVSLDVDMNLGTITLQRLTAAHDVGRAINPLLVEGQIHGGVAQGIGLALMEAFIPGRTENLHDYLIPTIGDVPPIDTHIIEVEDPHGPFGAKGLGEHVLIPTAPAILNAIAHASGARLRELPATPDRVLAAIQAEGRRQGESLGESLGESQGESLGAGD